MMENICKPPLIPKASTSSGMHATSLPNSVCYSICHPSSLPENSSVQALQDYSVFHQAQLSCPPLSPLIIDDDALCWLWLEEISMYCFGATLSFWKIYFTFSKLILFCLWAGSVLSQRHILTYVSSLLRLFVVFESLVKCCISLPGFVNPLHSIIF